MLNNEKQLKNILKKIINENYRRHLIKEQDGDADFQDENVMPSTNSETDAGVESTQDVPVQDTGTVANNSNSQTNANAKSSKINMHYWVTDKFNPNAEKEGLKPGQMKLVFKEKNMPESSNTTAIKINNK